MKTSGVCGRRLGVLRALVVIVLLGCSTAFARPEYPSVVRDTLEMPCTPACLLCHTELPQEADNARQPFLGAIGIPSSTEDLASRVLALTSEDSDVDGTPDVDELKAGRDPNVVGEGDICAPDVRYGCGAAHLAGSPPASLNRAAWFVLGGLLIAGLAKACRTNRTER